MYENLKSNLLLRQSKEKNPKMKNVSHKKIWRISSVQTHVQLPLIIQIKSKNDKKAEKYCVEIHFRKYPTSENLDLYEFKMAFLDNNKPEELLLLMWNFKIMLDKSGIIAANTRIQYLCTLSRGEALCQFGTLCAHVASMTIAHLNRLILGLGITHPPCK